MGNDTRIQPQAKGSDKINLDPDANGANKALDIAMDNKTVMEFKHPMGNLLLLEEVTCVSITWNSRKRSRDIILSEEEAQLVFL